MKELELNGHKVQMYSSIEELPMIRFHKYNKCLLVDAGIGSDLSAVDARIERCVRYIKANNRENAAKEMENLRQSIYMVMQGLSPEHMAFACMVATIDGEPCEDISDDGLQKVLSLLGGATIKDVAAKAEDIKKKLDTELSLYFPAIFDDSRTKEYYDLLRERALAQIDCILLGDTEKNREKVEALTDRIITFAVPKCYTGKDSVEIDFDKQFETMCLVIAENTHADAKKMTVLEYYNAYQYIEKQMKAKKPQNKAR